MNKILSFISKSIVKIGEKSDQTVDKATPFFHQPKVRK